MTVRLLDPPLHEFLPKRNQTALESFTYEEELLELSARLGISHDECVVRNSLLLFIHTCIHIHTYFLSHLVYCYGLYRVASVL